MSRTINYEVSDAIREALAEKLDLRAYMPLEIPCTWYESSAGRYLYAELNETLYNAGKEPYARAPKGFSAWYNTNYPAAKYENDNQRLSALINDIIKYGAIVYSPDNGSTGYQSVALSSQITIKVVESTCGYYYGLNYISGLPENIVDNSDIAEGTKFITFKCQSATNPDDTYEFTICK